jgi:hypothetical protein
LKSVNHAKKGSASAVIIKAILLFELEAIYRGCIDLLEKIIGFKQRLTKKECNEGGSNGPG